MLNALQYSHFLLDQLIQQFPEGNFIDATLGKGKDAYYILNHPLFSGCLYGFDIQEQAIMMSKDRLKSFPNFFPFQASHDQISTYIPHTTDIHGAIFNLGYLPGSDHQITTQFQSTLSAIQQICNLLVANGQIIIVVYSGHPQGLIEKDQLLQELKHWSQKNYSILKYQFLNQENDPPFTLVIEKLTAD